MHRFTLMYQTPNKKEVELGLVNFNGSFVFRLNDEVVVDDWNQMGLITVGADRVYSSKDLPSYINARLPIALRSASSEKKAEYIKLSGLRVPSDNFYFKSVEN